MGEKKKKKALEGQIVFSIFYILLCYQLTLSINSSIPRNETQVIYLEIGSAIKCYIFFQIPM